MRKLKKTLFFVLLTSCSYRQVDTLRFDSSEYRCAADGLCLHATGEFSLQAGYREGAAEIRGCPGTHIRAKQATEMVETKDAAVLQYLVATAR